MFLPFERSVVPQASGRCCPRSSPERDDRPCRNPGPRAMRYWSSKRVVCRCQALSRPSLLRVRASSAEENQERRPSLVPEDARPVAWPPSCTGCQARLVLLALSAAVLISVAVCVAAIAVPAPAAVAPLVAMFCVGGPIFAGWQAPEAVARMRAERFGRHALAELQRRLVELPETEHPVGL